MRKAGERNIEVSRYRKFLAKLVPPMLEKAEAAAALRAQSSIDIGDERARNLDAELSRLHALRAIIHRSAKPKRRASSVNALRCWVCCHKHDCD